MRPANAGKSCLDRIKQMAKFKAWFYSEGMRAPTPVALDNTQHG
jgi:hypothetical protein